MMNNNYVYSEVLEVLDNMEQKYLNNIPIKFIELLKKNASCGYVKHINPNIPLQKQNLNKMTLNILAIINLKYWVNDEEYKRELLEKYKQNNKRIENLHSQNSIVFRKKEEKVREEIKLQVIKKEGLLRKFIKIIKNIFRQKTS